MYMRDGLHLSRKGAAVFTYELSVAVDSGMGSITNRGHLYTHTNNKMFEKHF